MTINTLRDRLLLRMLSQPTRDALFRAIFHNLDSEISHFTTSDDPEHIAPALTHLADLMEEEPQWTAQLAETF